MAEGKTKKTWSDRWEGLKTEFRKIAWADRSTVGHQTTAVVIVSVILALIIVCFDMVIQYGVDKLVNL